MKILSSIFLLMFVVLQAGANGLEALTQKSFTPSEGMAKQVQVGHSSNTTGAHIRIAIVSPTFTAAAYNNAFYTFYKLYANCISSNTPPGCRVTTNLNLLTGKIPLTEVYMVHAGGRVFPQTHVNSIATHIQELMPNSSLALITDADINDAPDPNLLNNSYNILILGHQEYVTQKEYDNLRGFVANGGTLICMDGNIFYAEVSYNKANQTVTLINGHNHAFNGKFAYKGLRERWQNETSDWLGSNFWVRPAGLTLKFINNPFGYMDHEQQYVTNPNVKNVIMKYTVMMYRKNSTNGKWYPDPQITSPQIETYEKNYGKGKVIVFGIYSDEVLDSPAFLNFFDDVMLAYGINKTIR